ncbi:amino acid ABC transporter permease [Polaromonas jejuensis]|uniref:Amino acid ABC transporter permease n=1 Tax=Polaromonas jejuensis TaxID=457502 RepID=A0ABW0QF60_9BURK|nr:amino acid ABC transporter permease [Polaromonas jejuensis]
MSKAVQALRRGVADPAMEARQRNVAHAHVSRNYGRLLGVSVLCLLALQLTWVLVTNKNFEWDVVGKFLTEKTVINGLLVTLGLTLVAMVIGVAIGLVLAIARISDNPFLRGFAGLYVWLFRGLPLLVQLLFWYNLSTLFPTLSLGIPFGPTFATWNTNDLITPLTAAITGLALNEAAYMAEIIRAGLISVDSRQMETALAFGMTRNRVLRRIVIPQAMRSIVPPTGNQLISMVKATSIVSVIAMGDLLHSVQNIYNATFQVIPLLMVAVVWYLLITTVLNVGQSAIERYYAKGEQEAKV